MGTSPNTRSVCISVWRYPFFSLWLVTEVLPGEIEGCRSCPCGVVTGRAGALGCVQVRYPDRQGFSDRTEESNQRPKRLVQRDPPREPRVRHIPPCGERQPFVGRRRAESAREPGADIRG